MVEQEFKNNAADGRRTHRPARRPMCVSDSRAWFCALARRVGHGGGLEDFSHNLVGKISAGRENHLQMAGGVNDERAEIVVDGAGIGSVG